MDDTLNRRELIGLAGGAGVIALATGYLGDRDAGGAVTSADPRGLRAIAESRGLLIGSAVDPQKLATDAKLRAVLKQDADILVPENDLKWSMLQPTRAGPLEFGPAEMIWDFAHANAMKMRGHTLAWYRGVPDWAQALIPTLTPGQAGDMLAGYVRDVVGHWRGRITQWDVVNEPIAAKGQLLETLWSGRLGEQFIDLAYQAAHEADPQATLVLNQALIEQDWWYEQAQADQTLRLLERLLKRGVPIHAFGIEGHLQTLYGFSETRWRKYLDDVTGLGLKIIVTEFDVNDAGTLGDVARRDAAAAALATAFLDATLSYPQCLGLLTWGTGDQNSWLRYDADKKRADNAPQRPTLRDDAWNRKPLWQAVAAAIERAPSR